MKRYTVEEFLKKYQNCRHISCGINYVDGDKDCCQNMSCNQILSFISVKDKEVAFIISK